MQLARSAPAGPDREGEKWQRSGYTSSPRSSASRARSSWPSSNDKASSSGRRPRRSRPPSSASFGSRWPARLRRPRSPCGRVARQEGARRRSRRPSRPPAPAAGGSGCSSPEARAGAQAGGPRPSGACRPAGRRPGRPPAPPTAAPAAPAAPRRRCRGPLRARRAPLREPRVLVRPGSALAPRPGRSASGQQPVQPGDDRHAAAAPCGRSASGQQPVQRCPTGMQRPPHPGGPRPAGGATPGAMPPRPGGAGGPGGAASQPRHDARRRARPVPSGPGRPGAGVRPGRPGAGGRPGGRWRWWRRLRRRSRRRWRRWRLRRWRRRLGGGGRPVAAVAAVAARRVPSVAGGRPRRGRKSKKQRRQEFDNLPAPTMGGVQRPPRRRPDRPPAAWRVADRLRRQDQRQPRLAGPGDVPPRRDGHGDPVASTRNASAARRRARLRRRRSSAPRRRTASCSTRSTSTSTRGRRRRGDLVARPPVVTVMGHVDHGKTKLLDAIRNDQRRRGRGRRHHPAHRRLPGARRARGQDRAITFIDTPGHEAFTAMRARGAKVTDIAILVVAADDGVMPQTIEALNHAQAADVPIVVAVNKIDKEGANPAKVRQQLTEYGLVAEEYGGDTMFVDVSAKQRHRTSTSCSRPCCSPPTPRSTCGPNADHGRAGRRDRGPPRQGRGPVATVLVQRGTLRVGDSIVAGDAYGRVRAMLDEHGDNVEEAGPSPSGAGARPDRRCPAPATRSSSPTTTARPADRRAARGAASATRPLAKAPQARSRSRTSEPGGGQGRDAQPHPQGRRVRFGRGPRGRAAQDRRRRGGRRCGSSTAASVRSPRTTSTWPRRPTRSSSASTSGPRARRASWPTARAWRSATTRSSTRRSRRSRRPSRACSSRSTRRSQLGTAEVREVFRSCKFGNIAGCIVRSGDDPAQRQGAAHPRRRRRGREPHDRVAAAVQGRRHRGPRGLRVRHRPRVVQRHQGRATSSRPSRCARSRAPDTAADQRRVRHRVLASTPATSHCRVIREVAACAVGTLGVRPAARGRALAEGEALRRPADRRRARGAGTRVLGRRGRPPGPAPAGRDRRGGRGRRTPAHCVEVLDACERLVAGRPEVELLSARRQLSTSDDDD